MARPDTIKDSIKRKISAIEKMQPNKFVDGATTNPTTDLFSTDGVIQKNINDFTSKIKGRTQNNKDIFQEVIDTVESFIGSNTQTKESIDSKEKPYIKRKLLKYAKDSAQKTLQTSNQVLNDEVKKAFFGGTGLCNPNTTIGSTSIYLSPQSFDLLNMLKVDPDTTTGKIMYESQPGTVGIQFNRRLYEAFDTSVPNFTTPQGTTLFSLSWYSGDQRYGVGNLNPSTKIADFIDGYYNSIEQPNIEEVMKKAMQMTLQGDGTEAASFNVGMKNLNRLLTKLFAVCGSPSNNQPLLNNTPQQISEDEYDEQNYFNFDDVEGIDLDDEDTAYRRVLKFRDCNNFEVPSNSNHIEDFSYLLGKKNLDENINNTLNKAASDAYEQSGGNIYLEGFQISLTSAYILKIPKALMASVLSPKMIFPIAVSYQKLKSTNLNVKDMMKSMYKLFFNTIKTLFWTFIREFWKYVKKDLLNLVKVVADNVYKNRVKKFKAIILTLINVILKALESGVQSCNEIFNTILKTLNTALNRSVKMPIPGLLLSMSDSLPGFSTDRAYMKALEKMEAAGIDLNPIYGTENKFPSVIKAIIESYSEEMDENSFVKVGMKFTTIPANGTNAYITPFNVVGAGKVF